MRDLLFPPNWEQLFNNSSELVKTEQIDLKKTWFEVQDNITEDTVSQIPSNTINDPLSNIHGIIEKSQAGTTPNEGVEDNFLNSLPNEGESGNTTSNEGASIPKMTQEISWADDSVPDSNSISEGVEEL